MSTISDLEAKIRDYINAPRKHLALFREPVAFFKLCSCLDVIGDTEWAFSSYEAMADSDPPGSTYLLLYGFLQALFLQQDAVSHLYEALGLKCEPDQLLLEIRDLRNDAVGHPTKRGGGKGKSFSFISRASIGKSGFSLMTATPDEGSPPRFRDVSLATLLDTQRSQLEAALQALLDSLRREEMEHRGKFKDDKLAAVFPSVLQYYFEKVYESTHGTRGWQYGGMHVQLLAEVVGTFRAALERRGIAGAYQGVEEQLKSLDYPIAQLAQYFADEGKGRLNEQDAVIFTSFVQREMSQLKDMAIEIDKEYSEQPE